MSTSSKSIKLEGPVATVAGIRRRIIPCGAAMVADRSDRFGGGWFLHHDGALRLVLHHLAGLAGGVIFLTEAFDCGEGRSLSVLHEQSRRQLVTDDRGGRRLIRSQAGVRHFDWLQKPVEEDREETEHERIGRQVDAQSNTDAFCLRSITERHRGTNVAFAGLFPKPQSRAWGHHGDMEREMAATAPEPSRTILGGQQGSHPNGRIRLSGYPATFHPVAVLAHYLY